MTKTTFGQIAIGTKFREPGKTNDYKKLDARLAVRTSDGMLREFSAGWQVVPEHNATAADILGSWAAMR